MHTIYTFHFIRTSVRISHENSGVCHGKDGHARLKTIVKECAWSLGKDSCGRRIRGLEEDERRK